MTPAEALFASTSRAAEACGLGHRKGRLAIGYDADILAVDGDPLQDPAVLHRIRAVYVRGAALDQSNAARTRRSQSSTERVSGSLGSTVVAASKADS
jgi:cytosine/adenosine deaminase-related metal-dependent hydrolase